MAATINWSTAAELWQPIRLLSPRSRTRSTRSSRSSSAAAFPEMRQALDPGGPRSWRIRGFGPVKHFRDLFVAGWHSVLEMIRAARPDSDESTRIP